MDWRQLLGKIWRPGGATAPSGPADSCGFRTEDRHPDHSACGVEPATDEQSGDAHLGYLG